MPKSVELRDMKPILRDLPMPIETPRLYIRPPKEGDGIAMNQELILSYENIKHTMPWAKNKPTVDDSEEFVRQAAANWILKKNEEPYLPLFIYDKKNEFIGSTGYHHIDWAVLCLEIGYWISDRHANQGYMTEAVNGITQYAFKELCAKRVAITCAIDNVRSKKIPERLGFVHEATLKANRVHPDTSLVTDTLIFARYDLRDIPELSVQWRKHG